ncbi:MAG: alanine racemase [Actinobacteria bacterium]|nr:alanine racemase [Actinomycetota bacterium]
MTVADGRLHLDDLDLVVTAEKLGSPLYIYSAAQIEANVQRLRAGFSRSSHITRIFYAAKACGSPAILRLMRRLGVDIEVNSGGELQAALDAGFSPRQILFNGVAKTDDELRLAAELDIAAVVIDSLWELQRLAHIAGELHRRVGVSLRLDVGVAPKTHPGLVTSGDAKAGIAMADAFAAFSQAAAEPSLKLLGVHFHVGSQVTSTEPHRLAVRAALDFLDRAEEACGVRVRHIDIGGGFAIPYTDAPPNGSHPWFRSSLTPADYADAVFAELRGRRDDVEVFIEPGRYLVGNAAVLLSRVVSRKSKLQASAPDHEMGADGGAGPEAPTHTHWLFVDAGFNTLLNAVCYDWYYHSIAADRAAEPHSAEFRLAGPLCDGGDVHPGEPGSRGRLLPAGATVGDPIAFLNTGAYTWDTRSTYNGRFPARGFLLLDECLVPM